jgi:hypothetical protein
MGLWLLCGALGRLEVKHASRMYTLSIMIVLLFIFVYHVNPNSIIVYIYELLLSWNIMQKKKLSKCQTSRAKLFDGGI